MLKLEVEMVFLTSWNERSTRGLLLNIGLAVTLVLLVNALIFLFSPSEIASSSEPFRLEPPGWVIGVVWTLLFAGLGAARWQVLRSDGGKSSDATWVLLLLLICAAYPLYTSGLRNPVVGLWGNAATGLLALWIAIRIRRQSAKAAVVVFAVAAWLTFASFLTFAQIQGRSF